MYEICFCLDYTSNDIGELISRPPLLKIVDLFDFSVFGKGTQFQQLKLKYVEALHEQVRRRLKGVEGRRNDTSKARHIFR